MRILQLNVWTGRMRRGLWQFLEANKDKFDVVCMQEAIWTEDRAQVEYFACTVDQAKEMLGFEYEIRASNWGIKLADGQRMEQGNAILSRYKITESAQCDICGTYNPAMRFNNGDDHYYNAIKATLENGITVMTYHGYWLPDPIGNKDTVRAMRRAADFIRDDKRVVMCGDLNVNCESPAMRELDFLTDLTQTHNVKTTLTGLQVKADVPCDHILVSDDIEVENFEVLPDIVSDHCALIVDVK